MEGLFSRLKKDQDVNRSSLMQLLKKSIFAGERSIEDYIHSLASIERYKLTNDDIRIITTKVLFRAAAILIFLPLVTFLFTLIFFWIVISNQVLSAWVSGNFIIPAPMINSLFAIDGLSVLRIKAALLLSFFSSTLTIGTFITSEGKLDQFVKQEFASDIDTDKQLLVLNKLVTEYSSKLRS
jgi:hypothetical protein